ncbi:SMP-30/gluconolactonase/LRE family protein [Amycolatopsis endophytica]|uniref:Sugar lactone lactonase YvrE n=1 Tax=Amycolatopsis endophytica TaxID=860233 RepID=A0A853B7Q5_9PSEU|nr:SMP-30/gluconolactonase/LRE family protein [Amycolatopsis endophytica]NYI90825.1 sugar lactone lactonase YvrE [Amycolatopsis endophytica]
MVTWSAWPGERFELGEGLRSVGGRLVMVDILTGRLLDLPDGEPPRVLATVDGPLGAVAPLGSGWIAAAGEGISVLGGRVLARLLDGRMRMNDGVADPRGRFWAGSMAYDNTPGAGSVYRVDTDGTVTEVLRGYTVPNGPAFDATGSTMYLADSAAGEIHRYSMSPDGDPGPRSSFARVHEGSPDGMTVDDEGHLWSAIWGAGEIRRYAPDGSLTQVLEVPARQPTSVCLHRGRLIVTTATHGLPTPGPLDGAVLATPIDVTAPPARSAHLT